MKPLILPSTAFCRGDRWRDSRLVRRGQMASGTWCCWQRRNAVACAVPGADADDRDEDKPEEHPLIGSMWDSASADEISETELAARIAEARFILLGEKHDNPHHHVRQADLLTTASDNGRRPAVVWEMIAEGKRAVLKAFSGRQQCVCRWHGRGAELEGKRLA